MVMVVVELTNTITATTANSTLIYTTKQRSGGPEEYSRTTREVA